MIKTMICKFVLLLETKLPLFDIPVDYLHSADADALGVIMCQFFENQLYCYPPSLSTPLSTQNHLYSLNYACITNCACFINHVFNGYAASPIDT